MPQGRRKAPFSGKAKKEQLKAKKNLKTSQGRKAFVVYNSDDDDEIKTKKINEQPSKKSGSNTNRYALKFYSETNEELQEKKIQAREEIVKVKREDLEINGDDYFIKDFDFPKRPEWSYDLSRQELEMKENRYFTEYVNNLEKKFDWKKMSYFELNLETWRQLWRVLEMSDMVLFIVDIRYPALMFPPSLYEYVTNTLHKDMILVLNKIDLVPAPLVVAWKHYFQEKYPFLHVVLFTTVPGYNLRDNQNEKSGLKSRRRKGRPRMTAEGAQLLFEVCEKIVKNQVDLSSWQKKIKEEMLNTSEDDGPVDIEETVHVDKVDTSFFEHEKFKNGILTIGCIGQPNVGKSSVMNALMGKKVVSVSRTPGHTKHFQTIFLTSNVRLCDCPGLVFPSQVPKALQVLMGSYPIAQLRDPYTTIRFLAERINLIELLKIQHPTNDDTWSTIDICDGWAKKRGFLTAKAARLDTYRAANNLLRMSLDGKITLCLYPPGYIVKEAEWSNHPEIKTVQWIRAIKEIVLTPYYNPDTEISDESEDESDIDESDQTDKESENQSAQTSDSDDKLPEASAQLNKFSLLSTE